MLAASLAAMSAPCAALEISRIANCDGGDVLRLRGDIKRGDYIKFRSYLASERRVVGLHLDSGGGSLYEGVRIAALTRHKKLATYVSDECDSACAFIFLLGRKRYVSGEAKIGVHAVGNDYGSEDNGTIRDTIRFARVSAKLGIPSSAIGKMVTTPPGKIAFLDRADLAALKVIVRDPFRTKSADGVQGCRPDPESLSASANAAMPQVKTSQKPDGFPAKRGSLLQLR